MQNNAFIMPLSTVTRNPFLKKNILASTKLASGRTSQIYTLVGIEILSFNKFVFRISIIIGYAKKTEKPN